MNTRILTVTLSSAGNPDIGQDPEMELSPTDVVRVESLMEASAVCRRYIRTWNLGSGNWTGGEIRDESGMPVALVSYNGRVWTEDGANRPSQR